MELKIEYLPIKALKPYEKNTRKHTDYDVGEIAKSIMECGFNDPIGVYGESLTIVEGHGRLLAAKKLGMKEVPCIRLDHMTDEQRRKYAILHNKTAELSAFDFDNLAIELEDLDFSNFDFTFGIEDDEEEAEIVEDEAPEVDEDAEPITKLGDIWQLGKHRLMCADSTDKEAVEMLMDGKKADMVFTDSPYGINAVGDNGQVGADFGIAKKGKYKKIIADDTTETAQQAYDIYSQLCDKMILWGGNYFLDFLPPSDGWLIWDKRGESGIRNTFADGEMAWCSFHTPVRIYHQLWNGMIREGEHEKRVHPTQKPIRMVSEILQDFTDDGDIILDVFGGSGSTLIACEQDGRNAFLMELDPRYADVIVDRWEKFTGKKAVLLHD